MLRRSLTAVAATSLALTLLTGCVPGPSTGPTSTPADDPGQTAEPSTAPTDEPSGTPVDVTCDQLVSADTLYVYNPNFGPIDDFTPKSGSAAASAVEYDGVACRWQNQTNGQNIDLSVARLDEESLTALKNTAFADLEMVPTYGDEAYFGVADSIGTAQVFSGPYWIVAESPMFFEPGDAIEIVDSAIAALG